MKRFPLILLFSLCFTVILFSQTQSDPRIEQATRQVQHQYDLDAYQTGEVRKIQERKFRNLAEIENLRKSNPSLYVKKRQGISKSTSLGIKKLLRDGQLGVFESYQKELQRRRSAKIAQLKESGTSTEDIKLAILDIE